MPGERREENTNTHNQHEHKQHFDESKRANLFHMDMSLIGESIL
jgi:hypothetical protein